MGKIAAKTIAVATRWRKGRETLTPSDTEARNSLIECQHRQKIFYCLRSKGMLLPTINKLAPRMTIDELN